MSNRLSFTWRRNPSAAHTHAAAGAGRFAKLAAGGDMLGLNASDGFLHQRMVIGQTRKRGRGRFARGGAQDLVLALGDGLAFFVHPGQRIVAIGGADINHDAGGGLRAAGTGGFGGYGGQRLGGKHDAGQIGNGLFQRRIDVAGVFPNLVGQRRKIHFVCPPGHPGCRIFP
jgi:hypothetical protein